MKKRKNLFLLLLILSVVIYALPCFAGGSSDSGKTDEDTDVSPEVETEVPGESEDYSGYSDTDLLEMAEEAEENGDIETADAIQEEIDHRHSSVEEAVNEALDAYESAREALAEAKAQDDYDDLQVEDLQAECDACYSALEDAVSSYNSFNDAVADYDYYTGEARDNISIVNLGDPVDIATGSYLVEKKDMGVLRNYRGGIFYGGSFGSVWSCSLDTRLIRGTDCGAAAALAKIEESLAVIQASYDSIYASSELDPDCKEFLSEAESFLITAKNRRDELTYRAQKSAEAETYNVFTNYGPFSSLANSGTDYFIYITESGNAIIFKKQSDALWLPVSSYYRQFYTLKSDGDGFTVSKSDGIQWYFSLYGLPQKKVFLNGDTDFYQTTAGRVSSVVRSGNHTLHVVRNAEHRIVSAYTDSGESVSYAYNGSLLKSVCDSEGDICSFEYDGNYISKYIESGGSIISIEYTAPNSSGKRKTSATVNAAGEKETFAYDSDARTVTHTDYSGVKTVCVYDGNGRTKSIRYADNCFANYEYDQLGNLICIRRESGSVSFSYDNCGRILQSVFPDGSKKQYTYDESGCLTSFSDRDGITAFYAYDRHKNCIQVSRGNAAACTFLYDENNRCTAKLYASGTEEYFIYDDRNNCIEKTVSGIERGIINSFSEYFEYDAHDRLVLHTDACGRKTYFSYKPHSICSVSPEKLQTQIITDSEKNIAAKLETDLLTGEMRRTDILYNRTHLPVAVYLSGISSDGAVIPKRLTVSYTYAAGGKLAAYTKYSGSGSGAVFEQFSYNSDGKASSLSVCRLDSSGKKIPGTSVEKSFAYAAGAENTLTVHDGLGNKYSFISDSNGNILRKIMPSGIDFLCDYTPAGRIIKQQSDNGGFYTYEYEKNTGLLSNCGEEGGCRSYYEYGDSGYLEQYTDSAGNSFSLDYSMRGAILSVRGKKSTTEYNYDKIGRCIQTTITDSVSKKKCSVTDFVYSDDGRTVTKISGGLYSTKIFLNAWLEIISYSGCLQKTYKYDICGHVICVTDGENNSYQYEYDACGKPSVIKAPDGGIITITYNADGNILLLTDATGIVVRENTYDECGRLASAKNRPGTAAAYSYNEDGFVSKILDSGFAEWQYEFSPYQRQVKITDAKGNVFLQTADSFGRKVSETDRLNKTQRFEYDSCGRLEKQQRFSKKTLSYEYESVSSLAVLYDDGSKNLIGYDAAGNIAHIKSPDSEIFYEYDSGGALIHLTDVTAGTEVFYTYDSNMRCTRKKGAGRDIRYEYDSCGRLSAISDAVTMLSVKYAYDGCGREIKKTFGNGMQCRTEYDKAGRMIFYQLFNADNSFLFAKGYIYGKDAQLTHEITSGGTVNRFSRNNEGELCCAEYSAADGESLLRLSGSEYSALQQRLLEISCGKALYCPVMQNARMISYQYDENKNLSHKISAEGTFSYSYDDENRLLNIQNAYAPAAVSGNVFCSWDDDGNLLSKIDSERAQYFTYTPQNRMASVTAGNLVSGSKNYASYSYDALGRRITVSNTKGAVMRTVYDGFTFEPLIEASSLGGSTLLNNFSSDTELSASGLLSAVDSEDTSVKEYRYLDVSKYTEQSGSASAAGGKTAMNNVESSEKYSSDVLRMFLYGNGAPSANFSQNGQFYFSTGRFDTIEGVCSSDSNFQNAMYYPFGQQTKKLNLPEIMIPGYNGKMMDEVSGFYNYGFRDYDPELCIFSTSDPVRDGGNWYSFCSGNPVDFCDLFGLEIYDGLVLSNSTNCIASEFLDHMDSRIQNLVSIINSRSAIENLRNVQHQVILADIYEKGAHGNFNLPGVDLTWCNQATYDVLKANGFDIDVFLNGKSQYAVKAVDATINVMTNIANGLTSLLELSPEAAQVFANSGVAVVGVLEGSNHLATVYGGNHVKASSTDGPFMANVGEMNGIQSSKYAFGKDALENNKVHFYIDTKQTGVFDDSNVARKFY